MTCFMVSFLIKFYYKKMIDCLRMKGFYLFKKIIFKWKLKNIPLYIILFKITKNTGKEMRLDEIIVFFTQVTLVWSKS